MDIFITVAIGGIVNIRPVVYNYKNLIRDVFRDKNYGDDIKELSYFLFINGNITRYYEVSGIYKPSYKEKEKCINMQLCINESTWNSNEAHNELILKTALKKLILDSSEIIKEISLKKKINFDNLTFENTVRDCL